MLCELGWTSLANRRIDARIILLLKIIHGYVAIELPTYFERPMRFTRHMHPLAYRQIHTAVSYYLHSFYPALIYCTLEQTSFCGFCIGRSSPLGKESIRSSTCYLKFYILFTKFFKKTSFNLTSSSLTLLSFNQVSLATIALFYLIQSIRKTCPCNIYPLKPHFYIVKLGYVGVYLFSLFLLQNIDCGYSLEPPRRGGSNLYPQSMFSVKIRKIYKKKIQVKIFNFFSLFFCLLHGQVFIMFHLFSLH